MKFSKTVVFLQEYSKKSPKTNEPYFRLRFVDTKTYETMELFVPDELKEKINSLELTEGDMIEVTINVFFGKDYVVVLRLADIEPVSL